MVKLLTLFMKVRMKHARTTRAHNTHTHARAHTHSHKHSLTHTRTRTHTHTLTHTYAHAHTHAHARARAHTHTLSHIHLLKRTHTHACTHTRAHTHTACVHPTPTRCAHASTGMHMTILQAMMVADHHRFVYTCLHMTRVCTCTSKMHVRVRRCTGSCAPCAFSRTLHVVTCPWMLAGPRAPSHAPDANTHQPAAAQPSQHPN